MLKLRLLTGPRAGRQLRVSDTKPVSVGRRVGRLRLHDSRVSKNHASIAFMNGAWVLRDLGSANGTFVNRRRIDGLVELETGDMVQMGRVLIKIMQADPVGMVNPSRKLLNEASGIGIDAFTASGATGALPAIDPGPPVKDRAEDGEVDLASIFADDDDDAIDFSEQSRSDATRVPADPEAGQTQHDAGLVELDPVADSELDQGVGKPSADATTAPTAEVEDEDDDPLLAGIEADDASTTDDLVQIEPEPIDDKPQPGTTMLTALDDKPEVVGLRLDQAPPEQPSTAPVEDEPESVREDSVADLTVDDASAMADETDELVLPGLDLTDDLAGRDDDIASEAADAQPTPIASDTDGGRTAADPSDEDTSDDPAVIDAPPPAGVTDADAARRAADASLTDTDEADADEPVVPLGLGIAHADLSLEDLLDQETAAIDPEAIAEELWPSDSEAAEAADEAGTNDAEPEALSAPETAAPDESMDPGESADVAGVSPQTQPYTDADTEADDALEAVAQEDAVADPEQGAAEPVEPVEAVDAVEAELEPADEPEAATAFTQPEAPADDVIASEDESFDIDAAFDALTVGLDDSVQMPAIRDEADTPEPGEPAAQSAEQTQPPGEADADEPQPEAGPAASELAGSQVDISFIQDALARLGEEDAQAPVEPDAASRAESTDKPEPANPDPEAESPGSAAAVADELDRDEQTHGGASDSALEDPLPQPAQPAALNQPPPGINPTSILPPTEPEHSYRPRSKKRNRWFYSALVLLIVGGLAGALAYRVFLNPPIAGKAPADNTAAPQPTQGPTPDSPASQPEPGTTGTAASPLPPINPDPSRPVLPIDPTGADHNTAVAGSAGVPNPFADGPGIIGGEALAGMTLTPEPGVALPTPTDRGPRPTEIIQPTLPGSTPGNTDDGTAPTPELTPIPDTPSPTPQPTPAIDTPARIVFLVDASGSLVDSLPQMIVWLGEAVDTIEPDERFTIIFFKASQAIEAEPPGLKAMTRELRATLGRDWLDPASVPVLPAGRSDPSEAIELALSYDPTDLYVLSDEAFARHAGDTTRDQAITLVNNAMGESQARLHGVQFFYQDEAGVLETLANQYNGTYEFVEEDIVPETNPIDLLEELGSNE